MKIWLNTITILAACAHNSGPPGPLTKVDLEVDTNPGETPVLLVYRDGDGPWQVPPPAAGSAGHYTLSVTNDYEYLVVCAQGGSSDAELNGATVADGTSQFGTCGVTSLAAPTTVAVTGTMAQAGTVDMNYAGSSSPTANWMFTLEVPTGPNDLIAYDASTVLIDRNEMINAPSSLGMINLGSGGKALEPVTMSVGNTDLGYEGLTVSWATANSVAAWQGSGSQVWLPPSSMLEAGDIEYVAAFDTTGATQRSVNEPFTGTPGTLALNLPGPFAGVVVDTSTPAIEMSWTAAPAATDYAYESVGTLGTPSQFTNVLVTGNWLAATHAHSLTFDVSPAPSGFSEAWQIPTTAAVEVGLGATGGDQNNDLNTVSWMSGYWETLNAAGQAALRRVPQAQQSRSTYRVRRLAASPPVPDRTS